jgi:hypothetical protein
MVSTSSRASIPFQLTRTAEDDFDDMVQWITSRATLALPLYEVEQEQLERSREMNRKLLQEHIRQRGDGDSGPKLDVQKEGDVLTLDRGRVRSRQIRSVFGVVDAERRGYKAETHCSVYPLDEQLALFGRSYSYAVQRWTVTAAVLGPFDEAIASVRERTGLTISKRTAEELVVEAAQDFDSFYEQRVPEPPESSGAIIVCSADCKGIPMKKPEPAVQKFKKQKGEKANKKRMATVAAVHTQIPRIRTAEDVVDSLFRTPLSVVTKRKKEHRPQNKRVWASLTKGKDSVIKEAVTEVEKRDPQANKTRVILTDGEKALQRKTQLLLPGAVPILDLLHALQYLWAVACAFFGEKNPMTMEWTKKQTLRILQGKVSRVIQGIRQSATKRGLAGQKKKIVDGATKYYYRNRASMRYDEYLAQGLPIASGAVEGACKNLINDRMERSGMRWVERSAEAMLQLRAIYLSGDFEDYWTYHLAKERERYLAVRAQPCG